MSKIKKTLYTLMAATIAGLMAVAAYGMGDDIMPLLPTWLTKFIIGTVSWFIISAIALVFIVGVISIVRWLKESQS